MILTMRFGKNVETCVLSIEWVKQHIPFVKEGKGEKKRMEKTDEGGGGGRRKRYCQLHADIQVVPKPMSQTSPGYSPPLITQKSSYQHGSKSELVPRYPLTFMCGYPLSIT